MQVFDRIPTEPPRPEGAVVTIGAYDGVHLGHRTVLAAVAREAARRGLASVVVTFEPHPAEVVRPDSAPRLLTDLDQKLELLATTGIDATVVVPFDAERANEEAEHFVRTVLVAALAARLVVVGEDFHFGHLRQGNVAMLSELGAECDFEVIGHHLVAADGSNARDELQVSSTAIRRALAEGRLDDASAMLGRPHEMRGPVVSGDRRGRTIGFPTANVAVSQRMLMPDDGIYAGWMVRRHDTDADTAPEVLPAAIYIGKRPTFHADQPASLLEVHCLAFDGDLYGESVAVRLTHHIRGDRRFDGAGALAEQLGRDCDEARRLLRTVDAN